MNEAHHIDEVQANNIEGDAWGFSLIWTGSFEATAERTSNGYVRVLLGLNQLHTSVEVSIRREVLVACLATSTICTVIISHGIKPPKRLALFCCAYPGFPFI
jgi:alpha-galactosidase